MKFIHKTISCYERLYVLMIIKTIRGIVIGQSSLVGNIRSNNKKTRYEQDSQDVIARKPVKSNNDIC